MHTSSLPSAVACRYSPCMAADLPDPLLDPAERHRKEREAVDEGGGGQSEGFELAEQELIEHTSHGDEHATSRITRDAAAESDMDEAAYGEADEEHLTD
jgi:hypothetical protein